MTRFHSVWQAREQRRWLRNDAHHWLRPDHARCEKPRQIECKYNPNQPYLLGIRMAGSGRVGGVFASAITVRHHPNLKSEVSLLKTLEETGVALELGLPISRYGA